MKLSDKDYAKIIVQAMQEGRNPKQIAPILWYELSQKHKLKNLNQIIDLAHEIVAEKENRITAVLYSTDRLNEDQKNQILFFLKNKFKKQITIKEELDSTIGAGVAIIANGYIYNLSLKNKIQQLKKVISN